MPHIQVACGRHARGVNRAMLPVWLIYLPVGDLGESLSRVQDEGGEVVEARKGASDKYAYAVIRDPVGCAWRWWRPEQGAAAQPAFAAVAGPHVRCALRASNRLRSETGGAGRQTRVA